MAPSMGQHAYLGRGDERRFEAYVCDRGRSDATCASREPFEAFRAGSATCTCDRAPRCTPRGSAHSGKWRARRRRASRPSPPTPPAASSASTASACDASPHVGRRRDLSPRNIRVAAAATRLRGIPTSRPRRRRDRDDSDAAGDSTLIMIGAACNMFRAFATSSPVTPFSFNGDGRRAHGDAARVDAEAPAYALTCHSPPRRRRAFRTPGRDHSKHGHMPLGRTSTRRRSPSTALGVAMRSDWEPRLR